MGCAYSLFAYYEASPDWIKAVWVLSAPAFIAVMTGLILHHRIAMRRLRLDGLRLDRRFDEDRNQAASTDEILLPRDCRALGRIVR